MHPNIDNNKNCLVCVTEDFEQQLQSCSAFLTASWQKMKWENGGILQRPDWEKEEAAGADKEGRACWTSCVSLQRNAASAKAEGNSWHAKHHQKPTLDGATVRCSLRGKRVWANSCFTSEVSWLACHSSVWIFQLREEIQAFFFRRGMHVVKLSH